MYYKDYIEAVVEYVEDHLTDELNVEIISDKIGYSKFYLQRIFLLYTGYSIMVYVRKRRLQVSLDDLRVGMRILDIAVKYGYGSERAYSRAFVKEFKASPSQCRTYHKRYSKMNVYDIQLPNKEWINKMKHYLSEIKYETIEKMTVISGIRVGFEPEDEIVGVMEAFATEHQLSVKRKFGFDSPVSAELSEQGQRGYEFWLVVDEFDHHMIDASEFEVKHIDGYKYAGLIIEDPFENPMEKIPNGWKTLVAWLDDNVEVVFGKNKHLNCLEEVLEIDGTTCMNILVPIAEA